MHLNSEFIDINSSTQEENHFLQSVRDTERVNVCLGCFLKHEREQMCCVCTYSSAGRLRSAGAHTCCCMWGSTWRRTARRAALTQTSPYRAPADPRPARSGADSAAARGICVWSPAARADTGDGLSPCLRETPPHLETLDLVRFSMQNRRVSTRPVMRGTLRFMHQLKIYFHWCTVWTIFENLVQKNVYWENLL